MTTERRIIMSRDDHERLAQMSENAHWAGGDKSPYIKRLNQDINAATVMAPSDVPSDVVRMGSQVHVMDLNTKVEFDMELVFPQEADAAIGRISILAPSGTALIGSRVGDTIEFDAPGGLQRLKVLAVA